ncbi:MAG: type II toxin-antitoxin system Phd/YefM family antitoxin [Candidatus Scalindua sp.]|nr:type II toxin-antitoxin system Phd/YefM family antitoxin [Candidatus Scalindua sp.]
MKVIPASEAKTNFGALLDSAQREPVTISKKGRLVAVMMSVQEYEEHEALKLKLLRKEIRKGLKQLDKGKSTEGQAFMKALIKDLD